MWRLDGANFSNSKRISDTYQNPSGLRMTCSWKKDEEVWDRLSGADATTFSSFGILSLFILLSFFVVRV